MVSLLDYTKYCDSQGAKSEWFLLTTKYCDSQRAKSEGGNIEGVGTHGL